MPEQENKTTRPAHAHAAPYVQRQSKSRAVSEKKAEPSPEENRSGKRKRRIRPLVIIIPTVLVAALVVFLLIFARSVTDYKLKESVSQHYVGSTFDLPMGKLHINDEGSTELVSGESRAELSSLPLYSNSRDAVIVPTDMVYYDPTHNIKSRVDHFSELELTNGTTKIINGRRSIDLASGFLYDGEDIYLFLQPVTLKYNNYTIELDALSYIEVNRDLNISWYNYETGENETDTALTAVSIRPKLGDYTIQLISDSLELDNGNKILLFNRADLLEPLL